MFLERLLTQWLGPRPNPGADTVLDETLMLMRQARAGQMLLQTLRPTSAIRNQHYHVPRAQTFPAGPPAPTPVCSEPGARVA